MAVQARNRALEPCHDSQRTGMAANKTKRPQHPERQHAATDSLMQTDAPRAG